MKITCSLTIQEPSIKHLRKAVEPENNPSEAKGNQSIRYTETETSITYYFKDFEKISTLRLTLEDLLSHLSFSKDVTESIQKKKIKKEIK